MIRQAKGNIFIIGIFILLVTIVMAQKKCNVANCATCDKSSECKSCKNTFCLKSKK